MKYFYNFLLLGAVFFVLIPQKAHAQVSNLIACSKDGIVTLNCIPLVINNIVNAGMIFAAIVAVIFIIISGIKLLLSGGDQAKVQAAKKTLTFAVIGLVIISLAFVIITFVGSRLGFKAI